MYTTGVTGVYHGCNGVYTTGVYQEVYNSGVPEGIPRVYNSGVPKGVSQGMREREACCAEGLSSRV